MEAVGADGSGAESGVNLHAGFERGRRDPRLRPETRLGGVSTLGVGGGEAAGDVDGVGFDGDVEVERGAIEEEVAEGAADEVGGCAMLVRETEEVVQELPRGRGERRGQFTDKVWVSHIRRAYGRVLP